MYDLGGLVYLDLNKTGSKFVLEFLKNCCRLDFQHEKEHEPVRDQYNPLAYHFITIRHPISQYSSLFRYGLEKKGWIYRRIAEHGHKDLYSSENYNAWLSFVLDQKNAPLLGEGYEKLPKNSDLGFLSFRFFCLSQVFPHKILQLYQGFSDPVSVAIRGSIIDHVIKNEELNSGLERLAVELKPELFYQDMVEKFFKDAPKVNVSNAKEKDIEPINKQNREIIEKKEYLLLDFY